MGFSVPASVRGRQGTSTRLVAVDLASRSDEDLLELVALHRDGDAFEQLYQRYARAVYGVVRRMLGEHFRAEDVAQEAFTSVWRAAAGYRRERGPATGWLFAIARNAAADALRAKPTGDLGEPIDPVDTGPLPDEAAQAAERAFRVHVAVDSLPEREREVIELAYWEGLSQSEVAARLSLPLGTVKTRTRSALARLGEQMSDERVAG